MIGSVEIFRDGFQIQEHETNLILSFSEELGWFVSHIMSKGSQTP